MRARAYIYLYLNNYLMNFTELNKITKNLQKFTEQNKFLYLS